jgi:polysaccharide biosynthesis protein PslG
VHFGLLTLGLGMKGSRLATWVAACLIAACASAPAAAGAGHGGHPDTLRKAQVQKKLVKRLAKSHLSVLEKPSCKRDGGPRRFRCRWRAEGRPPGKVPFECEGTAKRNAKGRWRIEGCDRPLVILEDPGPPPLFGYHDLWRERAELLPLAARGGAQIVRVPLEWDNVEPNQGQYMWYWYDRLYYQMISAGIQPLWYLARPPCWAQRQFEAWGECWSPGTPAWHSHDELGAFAAAAANRYPLAAGIQVWNEPNDRDYWNGDPDPQAYGDIAMHVASAVHASGSGIPIIGAGLSPLSDTSGDGIAFDEYLREAYKTGGPQLTDAAGVHPYPLSGQGTDWVSEVRSNMYRHLAVMNDFGDAGKPIWVTEIGVSNYEDKRGYTPDEQGVALATMHELMRRIPSVRAVLFHRFQDDPDGENLKETGYGVVDAAGNPKPAFCALAALRGVPC